MTVKLISAAAVLLLLVAAGCGGSSEPKTVPDVRGDRLDLAEERLDDAGLEYEEVGGGALGIVVRSNWEVCKQEPAPGQKARKVRLIVDRSCPEPPPTPKLVPDLVGDRLTAAEDELEREGIAYSVESWDGQPTARGSALVCDQRPAGGRRAHHVTLFVARRCTEPEPIVPDVVGEDLEDAQDFLREEGFRFEVVGFTGDPAERSLWQVCEQEPDAGEEGDEVTLFVKRTC